MKNNQSHSISQEPGSPEPWVIQFSSLIPQGKILDLACGRGRHGRYFLNLGYSVTFIDKDLSGVVDLESHPSATLVEYDLENNTPFPFEAGEFSGVIITNYLHRPLFPDLLKALNLGAVLIYKTFSQGNEQFGKPSNPDFLLQQDELLRVFGQELKVIDFVQQKEANPDRMTQAICAIREYPRNIPI